MLFERVSSTLERYSLFLKNIPSQNLRKIGEISYFPRLKNGENFLGYQKRLSSENFSPEILKENVDVIMPKIREIEKFVGEVNQHYYGRCRFAYQDIKIKSLTSSSDIDVDFASKNLRCLRFWKSIRVKVPREDRTDIASVYYTIDNISGSVAVQYCFYANYCGISTLISKLPPQLPQFSIKTEKDLDSFLEFLSDDKNTKNLVRTKVEQGIQYFSGVWPRHSDGDFMRIE